MTVPPILVIAPPAIINPMGAIAEKFRDSPHRYEGFPKALETVADREGARYFDINAVTTASRIDGIHLDEDQHHIVGEALVPVVERILAVT